MNKYNVNRPLYQQLRNTLANAIHTGVYPSGSLLPGTAELCDQYNVSKGTVKRALAQLEKEGILRCSQGRRPRVNQATHTQQHRKIAILLDSPSSDGDHRYCEAPWAWTLHQSLLVKLLREHNPAFSLSYRYNWFDQLNDIDGVIALEAYGKLFDEPSRLDNCNIPCVRIQSASHQPRLPENNTVYLDYSTASQQAAIYFLAHGVEHIVIHNSEFANRPIDHPDHRMFNFYQFLKHEGFPTQNITVLENYYDPDFTPPPDQFEFMKKIISDPDSGKYGFLLNDPCARLLANMAVQYKRKLKKELLIMSIGGLPTPDTGNQPELSSIVAPLNNLAETALEMLYELIRSNTCKCPNVKVPLQLQIRDT